MFTAASDSATVVEGKDSLKARGMRSPDRAEAILLSVYEPAPPLVKPTMGWISLAPSNA